MSYAKLVSHKVSGLLLVPAVDKPFKRLKTSVTLRVYSGSNLMVRISFDATSSMISSNSLQITNVLKGTVLSTEPVAFHMGQYVAECSKL